MPYTGEIRMFGGNFAPVNWLPCQGQILPISEYETLFNLLGTTYGGDGQESFNLPDLQGRLPVHMGRGPGVNDDYIIGKTFGEDSVTLTDQEIPQHYHALLVSTSAGTSANAQGAVLAQPSDIRMYLRDTPSNPLPASAIQPSGGSQQHENRMPSLPIKFIICLFGVFPHQ